MPKILVLNGPNLNMLGTREPEIYGTATYADFEKLCKSTAEKHKVSVDLRQSNTEGEIINWVQESRTAHHGIIINAGGYTHTSIAILDALLLTNLPIIEVHTTNIYTREAFRHTSYVSKAAKAVIAGLGIDGYAFAIDALAKWIAKSE